MTTLTYQQKRRIIAHKEELLDRYRDIEVLHLHWYEPIIDDFKDTLHREHNVDVDEVYFSGFCCQGDGACFTGSWTPTRAWVAEQQCPAVLHRVDAEDYVPITVELTHRGRYYHASSVTINVEVEEYDEPEDPVRGAVAQTLNQQLDHELEDFEAAVEEFLQDHMHRLYSDLEAEHEYMTSDEVVWDAVKNTRLWEGEPWFEEDEDEDDTPTLMCG